MVERQALCCSAQAERPHSGEFYRGTTNLLGALLLPLMMMSASLPSAQAADNGLALTPPLGWRSFNAFWGIVDQYKMETIMDAMVNQSRTVGGKPMSLLDLGYTHVGLDGGWNYCFPNNKTFHTKDGTPVWCDWAKGRPCQGNVSFPDPQHMVTKAKALGLSPGWCELHDCVVGSTSNKFDCVTHSPSVCLA